VDNFKKDVKKNFTVSSENEFNSFVDNYDSFKNHSIQKVKTKNTPSNQRCIARKTINEQCIRRKNKTSCFCGIHSKIQPFGFYKDCTIDSCIMRIMVLSTQDICGIVYHVDEFLNIYNTEDVIDNKQNPKIIGKATKVNDTYILSIFGFF
jgi:hypothetical protein